MELQSKSSTKFSRRLWPPWTLLVQVALFFAFWLTVYFWGRHSDPSIVYRLGGVVLQGGCLVALALGFRGARYPLIVIAGLLIAAELSSVLGEPHSAWSFVLMILAALAFLVPLIEIAQEEHDGFRPRVRRSSPS